MPTSTTLSASQKGFSTILVIVGVVVILSATAVFFLRPTSNSQAPKSSSTQNEASKIEHQQSSQDTDEPPLKLKSIGVNLDYYDPSTGKAGDFEFTRNKLNQNRVWLDYGHVFPVNASATGNDKTSLQPIFVLPLGTKVYSLVDGVVTDVSKLYSGDYSVLVANDKNSPWRYETEHVINVTVKDGDMVKAGQVVAEVSPHDFAYKDGFGMVEIGIFKGGVVPEHICPFVYLDSSIKDEIFKKLLAFYKSWEEYRGDSTLYPENYQIPGCLTLDPIEG